MSLARARALALVAVLVIAALILVLVAIAKDRQKSTDYAGTNCAPGAVKVKTKPLPDPNKIKINIFNGSGVTGQASQVANELKNRGFTVLLAQNAPAPFGGVAKLSYGPKEVAAAAVVQSYFLNEADGTGFDVKRKNDVIDVTIGSQFTDLGTKTEVNQAQAQIGNPSPPPGTCDGG